MKVWVLSVGLIGDDNDQMIGLYVSYDTAMERLKYLAAQDDPHFEVSEIKESTTMYSYNDGTYYTTIRLTEVIQ